MQRQQQTNLLALCSTLQYEELQTTRCNSSQHQHGKACSTDQAITTQEMPTHILAKIKTALSSTQCLGCVGRHADQRQCPLNVHYCLLCDTCSRLLFISSVRQHVPAQFYFETKNIHTSAPSQQLMSTPPHKIEHLPQLEAASTSVCTNAEHVLCGNNVYTYAHGCRVLYNAACKLQPPVKYTCVQSAPQQNPAPNIVRFTTYLYQINTTGLQHQPTPLLPAAYSTNTRCANQKILVHNTAVAAVLAANATLQARNAGSAKTQTVLKLQGNCNRSIGSQFGCYQHHCCWWSRHAQAHMIPWTPHPCSKTLLSAAA